MGSNGVGRQPGDVRRLAGAVGLIGLGELLLPLVAAMLVDVSGPWSGTALLMVRSLALLSAAALLWTGTRVRAALWAVAILGALAAFSLPATAHHLLEAVIPGELLGLTLALLVVQVATVVVGVLAARELELEPVTVRSAAVWVAAAGAVTFALSQLFSNVTVAAPVSTLRRVTETFWTPLAGLAHGPWTHTLAIVGIALVAVAAAVAVVRRWAPALAVPVALLPATIASALNDVVVGPVQPDPSATEPDVALAAGGWLNLLALLLLVAAVALAVRTPEDR